MQRIAIVDPNEASRESLRTLLLGVDFVWLEAECARYEYFFDVIQQSLPDLVIINLDSNRAFALNMVSQLSTQYPKLPILTVCSDNGSLLQSLQRGAKHFLAPPIGLEDLVSTLKKALSDVNVEISQGTVGAVPNASVITLLGSRGGVGCTSIAVNLAATLAADPANNVALIDLDLALGDADIAIELPPTESISLADLARNIERLDMNYLRRALVKHQPTNLSVLRHPLELGDISVIHEGHIERILNLLKISYTHLIVDLSKALLPTDLMALRMSDTILLVAQLELSSLRNVVRMVHSLSQEGNIGERLRVVMNRVGSETGENAIGLKKAEEVIGKPVYWQIPNEARPMMGSRTEGIPLIQFAPKSKIQQSFVGLSQVLSGKTPAAEPAKKRGWFN